jgi:hypothetical protein
MEIHYVRLTFGIVLAIFLRNKSEQPMPSSICRTAIFAMLCMNFLLLPAQAQFLDQIGVTALRAVTTNLDGRGIPVAQPEASLTPDYRTWQVNPAAVGQPTNLFTYVYSNMTATTFPNSLGLESGHADGVANQFYGIPNGVATNVAHVNNYEANDFVDNYVFSSPTRGISAAIVNQSFSFSQQTVPDQQQIDSMYDNYSDTYKILFVSPANNYGVYNPPSNYNTTNVAAPGTAYNCICVGAYQNGVSYNSLGPTLDNGRCKPDITALSDVTSFSTPQVAGAATVMMQAGLRGDGGSGNTTNAASDMRTVKVLLMNGAVKPTDWTNSCSSPLDARYGAGVLNLLNSYEQLAGGKHSPVVSNSVSLNAAHPPTGASGSISTLSGWDFNTNTSSITKDRVSHYYFNVTNGPGNFIVTATLVWNRQSAQTNINNLDLFLYDCANSNLVMCSTSLVDNVQHIYTNNLAQGRYDLQVWKAGGTSTVSASEIYALAWEFVPIPVLSISGDAAILTWPVYPSGYHVESATSLAAPAWSTNNLPIPAITNGMNNIQIDATNGAQFFHLRSL